MSGTVETVPVAFTVCGVERVNGRGTLVGLAVVEVDVTGVVLTFQGVQVVRTPAGLECRSPVWRHPGRGQWLPGVMLPPELATAMAAEVVATWTALP